MKFLCVFTRYQYGDQARGTDPHLETFPPALQTMGHEVQHFDSWDPVTYSTYSDLNHALLAKVRTYRPDVVLTVQRDYEIWIETLLAIRTLGDVITITWTTDDSFKFSKVSRFIGRYYDAISTTYDYRVADYRAAGIDGVILTQWAANPHWLHPPKPAAECRYPVSFVGAAYGPRANAVAALKQAGINVNCFGHGWPSGSIPSSQIPAIMRDSVISLNFSAGYVSDAGHDRQLKARTFEVPGAGGFLLSDPAPGLAEAYAIRQEIDVFHDLPELAEKIRYYLANPAIRDRIAQAGFQRTRTTHTYDQRLSAILDFAVARRQTRLATAARGPKVEKTALPVPCLSLPLKLVRSCLVRICRLLWGRERGLRAARRITFEASLKLCGEKTFRANSLPGRMFPYI